LKGISHFAFCHKTTDGDLLACLDEQ